MGFATLQALEVTQGLARANAIVCRISQRHFGQSSPDRLILKVTVDKATPPLKTTTNQLRKEKNERRMREELEARLQEQKRGRWYGMCVALSLDYSCLTFTCS